MTRDEMLAALTAERFGVPVRTDRRRPAVPATDAAPAGDITAIIDELAGAPLPFTRPRPRLIHVLQECEYAACTRIAEVEVDGWGMCLDHRKVARREAAS